MLDGFAHVGGGGHVGALCAVEPVERRLGASSLRLDVLDPTGDHGWIGAGLEQLAVAVELAVAPAEEVVGGCALGGRRRLGGGAEDRLAGGVDVLRVEELRQPDVEVGEQVSRSRR